MSIRYLTTFTMLLLPGTVLARPIDQSRLFPKFDHLDANGIKDVLRSHLPPVFQAATAGTTFYGGTFWAADSQRWEAYENQLWTFDSGVGSSIVPPGGPQSLSAPTSSWINPFKQPGFHATMEGWIGFDQTYSEIPYFRRVGVNDPRWQAVKCVGSAAGLQGDYSFWAGAFPQEANALCYASGQGYGNAWHVCIEHAFNFPGGNVTLSFQYKNETEDGFDYTFVTCEPSGSWGIAELVAFTGQNSGAFTIPLRPGIELPYVPTAIKIKFCVSSDGAWSDQDGLSPTACGAFAVDNIILSGAITHTATFETGDDGWVLSQPAPGLGGEWSNLCSLNNLPATLAPCACALSESVLTFFDDHSQHGHYQDNLAASPWIDLRTYGKVGSAGKLLSTHLYADLPLLNYIFVQFNIQWYPDVCLPTGKLTTSPWTSNGFVYYFGGVPQCTSAASGTSGTKIDFSPFVSPGAEQVRVALGVLSYCRFFANCTQLSNTTPWLDDVGLGVYGDPNSPYIQADDNGQAQDNFPANGSLSEFAPGRIDCNDIQGDSQPEVGTTLGDTLIVRGAIGNAEVYVHFRVRPGPGVDMTKFNAWYSSHPGSPLEGTFKRARCDTAEYGTSGPIQGTWMTAYHEADPNFAAHGGTDRTVDPYDTSPTGGEWRLSHDIFPDNLLTAGTRLDYFFSANKVGSSISWVDPPTAPSIPYEMEILPSSLSIGKTSNCILYVDHFGRGAQPIIEEALGSMLPPGSANYEHTTWDRYDVNAPASHQASLGRPLQTDYGATLVQLIFTYHVILWDSGDLNTFNLTNEDGNALNPWLTLLGYDYNNLYLSGNGIVYSAINEAESEPSARRLVEDIGGVTLRTACSTGTFRRADCPNAGSPQDFTPCVNLVPMPRPFVANSWTQRSVNHLAQGNGCPDLRSFDVLDLLAPDFGASAGDEYYSSPVKSARFASIATDASPSHSLHYRIVTDGLSVHYRRDEGTPCDFVNGGKTAVTERIREVLNYFGFANGFCPTRTTGVIPGDESSVLTSLLGISPNPVMAGINGRVRFSMAKDAPASIEILDLQGRRVSMVFNGPAKAGMNEATWDGRDASGAHVADGVYFYRFRALDQDQSQKMVVVGGGR